MPAVGTICGFLDCFAPRELAAEWDNVGLLLGCPDTEVQRMMTCLTITSEVVAEAVESGVQLIVTHHPILFRAAKSLATATTDGRLLWPLARTGISVYSPHTAFDNCAGGINDSIARRLGLTDVKPLRPVVQRQLKIVVFTPETDLQRVSEAMFNAGAGKIGQYSQCSFRLSGTGTFFGSDATNPTVGQKGRREEVSEWRLEVICPESCLANVLQAMRGAHSYEEPAFDVYPLQSKPGTIGEGRVGRLSSPAQLANLAAMVKERLRAGGVQLLGDAARPIERVAIACGAAGEFLSDARGAKADVFLTGEMRFHDYLKAKELGIALILPGHYATERPGVEELADRLASEWPGLRVWPSERETDPVIWV
jgi:dinuclear metal center YbgI/SA1388 family protein